MLRFAIAFFLLSVVAALLGFTGIASAFAGVAEVLFWAFLALFGLTLIAHFVRGHALV